MNRLLLSFTAILFFLATSYAQGAGIQKKPGDPVTLNWTYLVSDEPNASGYRLYSSTVQTGPFTYTGTAVTPSSLRTLTVPATFQPNSVVTWYTIRAFFVGTNPPATVESTDSNTAEVDRAVPTPTGLLAK